MTLSKWQPFQELNNIRKQMDSLFEDMLSVRDRDWMGLHGIGGRWTPAVEIEETEKELILKAEIPGIDAKDLDVEVGEDRVTISGEHKEEKRTEDKKKNYFHSEFYYGNFQRVIPLPMPIKTDAIKSEFKHGILTLTLPKVENVPKKVVKINLEDS
ncbi:MAG: Hsp20/alpha crystallin family protein [Xenococcaceae cyanobacterium MO_188.B32]|nr:Hsp20/alpha crystallin family protein [Xenococcaceae cyanobacterium MO_188.B32]